MKNNGWVKWSQYTDQGLVNFGQMPIRDVPKTLREFSQGAKELLDKTGADHVVYGLKVYDENGELEAVKFYQLPMDDATFDKDVATLKNCTVYALHKGTGNYTIRRYDMKNIVMTEQQIDSAN